MCVFLAFMLAKPETKFNLLKDFIKMNITRDVIGVSVSRQCKISVIHNLSSHRHEHSSVSYSSHIRGHRWVMVRDH